MTVTALRESGRRHPISGAGYKPEGVVSDPDQVTELLQAGEFFRAQITKATFL